MAFNNLNMPKLPFNVPFFIFDLSNKQLITTPNIPSDIADTKDIVLTETPIPGLNYAPIMQGGGGNRKLSFTLPCIKTNNTVGNLLLLKQFDMLRNQAVGIFNFTSSPGQFNPFPKVLFYYGIGSIPLVYFVKKCNATHKAGWVNAMGFPQYSEIEMELWLDENSLIYKGEEVFRKLSAFTGMVTGILETTQSQTKKDTRRY
jgi:hypothetical protein